MYRESDRKRDREQVCLFMCMSQRWANEIIYKCVDVTVKQNFALLERVMMAFWFGSSALTCAVS